jgi:hypothetical protein
VIPPCRSNCVSMRSAVESARSAAAVISLPASRRAVAADVAAEAAVELREPHVALEHAVEEHRSIAEHDGGLQRGERRRGDSESAYDAHVDAVEVSSPDLDSGLQSRFA